MASVLIQFGKDHPHAKVLRSVGLKATLGRVALLEALGQAHRPLRVEALAKEVRGKLDMVNTYRALEALRKAGLVERSGLGGNHRTYELRTKEHHHHAICRSCGTVEDIEIPHVARPEKEAEKRARKFSFIDSYSLEFFGVCMKCT